jgi:hypothetical protein
VILDPRRRNDDTIVFFSEFFRRGYKSDEGRAAIARMEQIHSNFLMDDELKAYTLATVVFEPERLAEQFGCSPFSDVEMQGRWNFWKGFAAAIFDALVEDWRRWYPDWLGGEKTARHSLTALLDDHLRETLELPKPSRAMALRVKLTASAYLRSTPIRLMRRDRSVINYFGKRHADPRDLENVGFKPRNRGQRDRSAL